MIYSRLQPAAILIKATVALTLLANLMGAALTFVFFCILEPSLNPNPAHDFDFVERAILFVVVIAFTMAIVGPINLRLIVPLYKKVKQSIGTERSNDYDSREVENLRQVTGRLMRLPVILAVTTFGGWCLAAIVVAVVPHVAPQLFPWPHDTSHKISAWLVLVGAPTTTTWVYFAEDQWLKLKIPGFIPLEALKTLPPTYRIGVLLRLLIVFLLLGILPATLISHITIHSIHEIEAGRQSIESFLNALPAIIGFLLATFVFIAIGLSIIVAKSFSEPLKQLQSAMETAGSGDLNVTIPVVSSDELGEVAQGFNRMVQEQKALESIKDTFGRYVSQDVVDEIIKSPGGTELVTEMREITVLVADLRGFTGISESLEPPKVLKLINRFLQKMTDIILKYQGTIDEFTGDGILVFFGAPRVLADQTWRAVACALEMQHAIGELNSEHVNLGYPELKMGIGINRGELIIGNIGSEKRKKYGAVGGPINIAFRIEAETKGGEILVSPSVRENLGTLLLLESERQTRLKGLERPITLYRVKGIVEPR